MINPSLSKVQISFSPEFFPTDLTKRYDDFFYTINYPFKSFENVLIESIQNISIPGFNLPSINVQNMANNGPNYGLSYPTETFAPHSTENRYYEGHEPWFNAIDNHLIQITFRNNMYNWMYCFEMLYNRYVRRNRVEQFWVLLTILDPAEIPVIRMKFDGCWVETLPPLEMSFNSGFGETKTFECGIRFNKFDVELCLPDFGKKDLHL